MRAAVDELIRKKQELVERQRGIRAELKVIGEDLQALDRVLRLLDPSLVPETRPSRRSRVPALDGLFERGELSASVLATLRDAPGWMSAKEVAAQLVDRKSLQPDDPRRGRLISSVSSILAGYLKAGRVQKALHGGLPHWQIAR